MIEAWLGGAVPWDVWADWCEEQGMCRPPVVVPLSTRRRNWRITDRRSCCGTDGFHSRHMSRSGSSDGAKIESKSCGRRTVNRGESWSSGYLSVSLSGARNGNGEL